MTQDPLYAVPLKPRYATWWLELNCGHLHLLDIEFWLYCWTLYLLQLILLDLVIIFDGLVFMELVFCGLIFTTDLDNICVTVLVFTTYWKFRCYCIPCLFGVNECQWLVYTHTLPFIWFLNIRYTSLTSVYSNLEHGLPILTESFSLLRSVLHNLSCWSPNQKSTSIDTQYNFEQYICIVRALILKWGDKPRYNIHLSCTTTGKNWFELVTASLNHVLPIRNGSTPRPLLGYPIFPPDDL